MKERLRQIEWVKFTGLLAFLLPVGIMLAIFAGREIYPFGDRSFLCADLYHQYMPFFTEFVHRIRAGEGFGYAWEVGIGSNFLALYVYYLASPLHWLAFLVPEKYLLEFVSYLAVFKIGLCGFTSYSYWQGREAETESGKRAAAVLFSVFYALSGFMAAYNYNIMWLDCVVILPLILLGLERLVKEGNCALYCLTLAFSIFTNYYLSIMICIFLVLYFLFLAVTRRAGLRAYLRFAFYSLLAGGLAGVLLIPEVCAIIATDFGDISLPQKLKSYFSVLDILARHCMGVTVERGLGHWPNIYCGAMVFLLLPLYVVSRRIPLRERFGMLALQGFLLLGFGTNILEFFWHGMNYPDSLPARQSFIYILLVLTMCYRAFCDVREAEPRHILYAYLGAAAFLLFVEKFVEQEDFAVWTWACNLGFVTVYAVLLYLYRTRDGGNIRLFLLIGALVTVIAESSANMIYSSVSTVSRSNYLDSLKDYQTLWQRTSEGEEGIFRMEKFNRKTKNDGTLAGYPSASVFSSTQNSDVMNLYRRLGMRYSKVFYCFDGATAFTSALLNVRYMLEENAEYAGETGYENELYTRIDHSGKVYLYRCEAALPFGYVAPSGYDLPSGFDEGAVRLQNQMVHDLGVAGELFVLEEREQKGDNVVFAAPEDGIYYGVVDGSGTKKLKASGGSPKEQKYSDLKDGEIVYLGHLAKADKMTLKNADDADETKSISVRIYRLDQQVLEEALEILGRQHMTQVRYDAHSVSGELTLSEAGRLILSVPAEKGWKVYVNGEKTQPDLFGGALMAFDLEQGNYRIEMRYTPQGKWAGIFVSAGSILLFACVAARKRKRA